MRLRPFQKLDQRVRHAVNGVNRRFTQTTSFRRQEPIESSRGILNLNASAMDRLADHGLFIHAMVADFVGRQKRCARLAGLGHRKPPAVPLAWRRPRLPDFEIVAQAVNADFPTTPVVRKLGLRSIIEIEAEPDHIQIRQARPRQPIRQNPRERRDDRFRPDPGMGRAHACFHPSPAWP